MATKSQSVLKFMTMILLGATAVALPSKAADYRVTDPMFNELATDYRTFSRDAQYNIEDIRSDLRYVSPEIQQRISRRLDSLLRSLGDDRNNVAQNWIYRVKAQSGNNNNLSAREFRNFVAVGGEERPSQPLALQDLAKTCDEMNAFFLSIHEDRLQSFVACDSIGTNIATMNGYYAYQTAPRLIINVDGTRPSQDLPGKNLVSSSEHPSPHLAFASWWTDCKSWIEKQKSTYQNRFMAAECGQPTNIATMNGYYLWSSQGILHLYRN
jgi:hypothetical protein